MKTKIKLLRSLEIFGVLLLFLGIILGIVGAEVLKIPFYRIDLVPIAVGFCGILLFISASSAVGYEKNKTKEQQIQEKDERMITIYLMSKSKSFDWIAIIFPFSLLALAMFGYMNKVSFFFLAGLYLVSIVYYHYQLLMNNKNM